MKDKLHPYLGNASTLNAGDKVTIFTEKQLQEMEEVLYDKSRGYSIKSKDAIIFIGRMSKNICGNQFIVHSEQNDESLFFTSQSCDFFIPIWAIKKIKKAKVKSK